LRAGIINLVVAGRESPENVAVMLAMPKPESAKPAAPLPASAAAAAPAGPAPAPVPIAADAAEFMAKSREDFLAKPSEMVAALHSLEQAVSRSATASERSQRLEVFYRKVHFLSATAGLAECHLIARMASAFEALLFELMEKPAFFGPSVLLTIARTVDFFGVLFQRALESDSIIPLATAEGLVVDDDPLSNRVVVAALRRAEVKAQSIEDPLAALQLLAKRPYDLILLDIEMPGLDGFELCRRVRLLPGYQKTPVIYVTAHADFDSRARSVLTGGNELISKPVFPIELAVKAVTHMLKAQLAQ
jgi:CheY-like chemotaxis protein